jgi:hypothetical protein
LPAADLCLGSFIRRLFRLILAGFFCELALLLFFLFLLFG